MIEPWKCQCGYFLGNVEDKKIVRIKKNDLYVEITGGKISTICRGCGKPNILEDVKPSDDVDLKE